MGGFQGKQLHPDTSHLRFSEKMCRSILERFETYMDSVALTRKDVEGLLQTQSKDINAVMAIFDPENKGEVDAFLVLAGLVVLSDATLKGKAEMFFELFDFDHSFSISKDEFHILSATVLHSLCLLTSSPPLPFSSFKATIEETFRKVDSSGDTSISQSEFISFLTKSSEMVDILGQLHLAKSGDFRINFGTEESPDVDSDLENEAVRDYARSDLQETVKAGKRPAAESQFLAVAPWLGTVLNSVPTGYEPKPGDDAAPSAELELEYVYGYRCHDVRNNLRYTTSGAVVYHTAALGIVLDPVTNTQKHFGRHKDDIIAFSQVFKGDIVATGEVGKTPLLCVWDTTTMECLKSYSGVLKHGVTHVAINEQFVAGVGADEDRTLAIYSWKSDRSEPLYVSRVGKNEVFAMSFNPENPQQLAVCGLKFFLDIDVADTGVKVSKGIGWGKTPETEQQALTCLGFIGSLTIAGAANGYLFHWEGRELAGSTLVHDGAVMSIGQRMEADGVVTGGNDGMVYVLDGELNIVRTIDLKIANYGSLVPKAKSVWEGVGGKVLMGTKGGEIFEEDEDGQVKTLMRGHFNLEVWGLTAVSQKGQFFTAGQDGLLALWDTRAHKQVAAVNLRTPITSIDIDYTETLLAVGLENGHLLILQTDTFAVKKKLSDRKKAISTVKFAPSGKYLAAGGHDGLIMVYEGEEWRLTRKMKGHHSNITGMDFSENSEVLQSVSSSYELLYHDLATGKQDTAGASRHRDENWASWTCILGFPVQGIWPPFSNGTDINAVRRSPSGKVVATADDFGKVKLFKYPCVKGGAGCGTYSGHSSHVTNVEFVAGKVLSTGGHDKAVFQWKYTEEDAEEWTIAESAGQSSTLRIDLDLNFDTPANSEPAKRPEPVKAAKRKQRSESQTAKLWAGDLQASKPDLDLPPNFNQHPTHSLSLHRVFGYRGFDSRNNLRVLDNGDIVYSAAALGVVMERNGSSQRFFQMHNDDVVSLAIHPERKIVATGQVTHVGETKALAIYVWDATSLTTLACLKGFHTRGVRILSFSPDGSRLLTIGDDIDHSLAVFDWKTETLITSSTIDKDAVTGGAFVDRDNLVVIGAKFVKFGSVSGNNCVVHKGIMQGKAPAFDPHFCVTVHASQVIGGTQGGELWSWSGRALSSRIKKFECPITALHSDDTRLFAASAEGTVLVLSPDLATVHQFNIRDFCTFPSIRSLDVDPTNKDVLVLGTKGSEVIELNVVKEYNNIRVLGTGHGEGELWGLCAHPSELKVATAGEDRLIIIWSLKTFKEEHRSPIQAEPFRALDWSHDGLFLVAASVKGLISAFSASTLALASSLKSSFTKGDCWIQAIRFSPSGKMVAFGAHGYASPVEIMLVNDGALSSGAVVNIGLSSALTHLDWSADDSTIMVNTQAYELKFIDVKTRTSAAASSVKETQWASWTCVLGWPVEFIWPQYSDGSDINACARSHSSEVLVTADDFGKVNLFRYPVVFPRQQSIAFGGHSSHVTNVCFTMDDGFVVSTGGLDKSVIVWKTDLIYDPKEADVPVILDDISSNSHPESFANIKKRPEQRELVKSSTKVKEITTSRWAGEGFMKPPSGFLKAPRGQELAPSVRLELDWVHGYRAK